LKINNSLDHPRWYDIPCKCNHDSVETEYPISSCLYHKFQACQDSLPTKDFKVNADIMDKNGKVTKKQTRIIKEVTIVRGNKYQDIQGWTWQ